MAGWDPEDEDVTPITLTEWVFLVMGVFGLIGIAGVIANAMGV